MTKIGIDNKDEITGKTETAAANIMYKTLGFKWLLGAFCPASTFVTADRDVARNPQRFIPPTVAVHCKSGSANMITWI